MIDFSIIVPVYNLENYIIKTLESICQNNLWNTEIIVVDDGSKDNSKAIAEDFLRAKQVPYYTVLSQKNCGVSAARNLGIEHAKGTYLIFCDGDDLCAANMIKTLDEVKKIDYDIVVWRYDILQEQKRVISQNEFEDKMLTREVALKSFLLKGNRIRLGSFAVKKSLLENADINFTVNCAIAEDIEFMYKCLAKADFVYTVNEVLFTYVKRAGSAMNAFDLKRFQAPEAIKRVYQYVQENTDLLSDSELDDYLRNGLYILHSMFSFDACITHLKSWEEIVPFLKTYYSEYLGIENEIKRASKDMHIMPAIMSKKRLQLFCLSRKVYVCLYAFITLVK